MRSDYSTLALGCVVGPWRFDFTLKLCKSWTQLFWVVHISLRANFYTLNVKICMQANKHMTKSRIYIYTLNVKSKCQGSTTQPLNFKKNQNKPKWGVQMKFRGGETKLNNQQLHRLFLISDDSICHFAQQFFPIVISTLCWVLFSAVLFLIIFIIYQHFF